MKLWKIEQNAVRGYDTYSDAVVAAETMEIARRIHPDGKYHPELIHEFDYEVERDEDGNLLRKDRGWDWPLSAVGIVKATLIGDALPGTPQGVICASFHAG